MMKELIGIVFSSDIKYLYHANPFNMYTYLLMYMYFYVIYTHLPQICFKDRFKNLFVSLKFRSLENAFLYILSLHCSRGSFRPLSGYDVKSQSRSRRQLQEAGATSMDLKRASSRRSFEQGLLINSMYNDYGFQGVDAET